MATTMLKYCAVGLAALVIAGCAPRISSTDFVQGTGAGAAAWSLSDVRVIVPEDMVISTDENDRYPDSDLLVWYGDPPGDRKAQVANLVTDAVKAGAIDAMSGNRQVVIEIVIDQFHAMTPAALATNLQLGVHEIQFDATVRDALTGEVIAEEQDINADLRAYSGPQAVLAEQAGQGQKIRIQTRISQVIRNWLLA